MGLLDFMLLAALTMFAVGAASALCWTSLGMAFLLIEPSTARRVPHRTELSDDRARPPRAFSANR